MEQNKSHRSKHRYRLLRAWQKLPQNTGNKQLSAAELMLKVCPRVPLGSSIFPIMQALEFGTSQDPHKTSPTGKTTRPVRLLSQHFHQLCDTSINFQRVIDFFPSQTASRESSSRSSCCHSICTQGQNRLNCCSIRVCRFLSFLYLPMLPARQQSRHTLRTENHAESIRFLSAPLG